jgi:WD40 repeat protein
MQGCRNVNARLNNVPCLLLPTPCLDSSHRRLPSACPPACSLPAHEGGCYGLAFTATGGLLASGGADKSVKLWEPSTATNTMTLHVSLVGAGRRVGCQAAGGRAGGWAGGLAVKAGSCLLAPPCLSVSLHVCLSSQGGHILTLCGAPCLLPSPLCRAPLRA